MMIQVPSHPQFKQDRPAKLTDPVTNEEYHVRISRIYTEMSRMEVCMLTVRGIPLHASFWRTKDIYVRPYYRYPLIIEDTSTDDGDKNFYMTYVLHYIHNGSKFFGVKAVIVRKNLDFVENIDEIRNCTTKQYQEKLKETWVKEYGDTSI